ncbi:Cyclic di-GMP phosphodiesterase Gmr [Pseudoruegeria aquimaris]|uniref:Cyclic di-GMP phosphodiesterase Gmr n=1 Tax=Pseudoruegeria aquimaris TaxID=393663 RepID=A0A1Y5SD91_9RHOB|nr:GGDEF domain-containing phosphodiesterase [Pseudoruegeria aquimaris]SLN38061.1 Cyclic di-GMP phosphodiesterase Gmr [Pseudoruegeria aquimaris]
MRAPSRSDLKALRRNLRSTVSGPQILAFLPAATLASYWIGGESGLLLCALGLPAAFALAGSFGFAPDVPEPEADPAQQKGFAHAVDVAMRAARGTSRRPACYLLMLDEYNALIEHYGRESIHEIERRVAERLARSLRSGDRLYPLGNGRFGVVTAPEERLSLEASIQIGTRLQSAITEPFSLDGLTVYTSCCVGFCLAGQAHAETGAASVAAAEAALELARRQGPGAIRAFTPEIAALPAEIPILAEALETALAEGQIIAHFQPQVSARTGEITGFEALARWNHPERGLLPPGEFLPVIATAGLSERLCHRMLDEALRAMARWRAAGLAVPSVSVNLSTEELRNPGIVDHIRWELDRHGVPAGALTLEVLETVAAGAGDEMIVRNLAALSALGCHIDLDDFGTGAAAIANIRRFCVQRIKIDRSFVTHIDTDSDQQAIVSGILSLAERLKVDTLAEGVETPSEQAVLAQMGCGHVQGYGIARPMPLIEAEAWIAEHQGRLGIARGPGSPRAAGGQAGHG